MSSKSMARLCGILFLFTIAAFLIANMLLKEPLHDTVHYANTFQLVKDNAFQYRLGNFIALMGVAAQFALMITLYKILKPVNPFCALLALYCWRDQRIACPDVSPALLGNRRIARRISLH